MVQLLEHEQSNSVLFDPVGIAALGSAHLAVLPMKL